MALSHIVRFGSMGSVGRFASADAIRYGRDVPVIVRTSRGMETGTVLTPGRVSESDTPHDGQILRAMTSEDHLLQSRLEKYRNEAFDACAQLLRERGLAATLLDVEHLFDGQGLYFHFLGKVSPEVESVIAELADTYETTAQIARFAETLTAGCGPDCGTEEGGGCQSCGSGCALADACSSR